MTSARLRAELAILCSETAVRFAMASFVAACLVVGVQNGLQHEEAVEARDASLQTYAEHSAAASRGVATIEGIDTASVLQSDSLFVERTSMDAHFGSVLGSMEAALAFAATALGLGLGLFVGVLLAGRDFERWTWYHELFAAPSRVALLRCKLAAGLLVAAMIVVGGVAAAMVGAAAGQLVDGHVALGGVRAALLPQLGAVAVVLVLWILVGTMVGLVATRVVAGLAAGLGIAVADAFIGLNWPVWGWWSPANRIAELAALWLPRDPTTILVAGETTSVVWWLQYPEHPLRAPLVNAAILAAARRARLCLRQAARPPRPRRILKPWVHRAPPRR